MPHNDLLVDAILEGPFELTPRPEPVAGDLRLAWGLVLLLFILDNSRGKSASIRKIHLLAHATRTESSRLEAQQVFAGIRPPGALMIRVEPWVNRAISFGSADGFLELRKGKSVVLKPAGLDLVKVLKENENLMVSERSFLKNVGKEATEGAIDSIIRMEPRL